MVLPKVLELAFVLFLLELALLFWKQVLGRYTSAVRLPILSTAFTSAVLVGTSVAIGSCVDSDKEGLATRLLLNNSKPREPNLWDRSGA